MFIFTCISNGPRKKNRVMLRLLKNTLLNFNNNVTNKKETLKIYTKAMLSTACKNYII